MTVKKRGMCSGADRKIKILLSDRVLDEKQVWGKDNEFSMILTFRGVLQPAALASPRSLLEMQALGPHPRPTGSGSAFDPK